MDFYFESFWLVRAVVQRGIAVIYLIAFINALTQFKALLGEKGLEPTPHFLKIASFKKFPSIFHLYYSDKFFTVIASIGVIISCLAIMGVTESGPIWLSIAAWLALWLLYLSIVNVGQTFYAFGWESMLLEAGFFTAFLGPAKIAPPIIPLLILRWMLFRTELGAGLIKIRHDKCWKDLTCMYYHYETQPLPNPLSRYFHFLPKFLHKFSVLFNHFVQLIVPFALFAPQPIASVSGLIIVTHQLILVISGNYAWLNWLTIMLGAAALSDRFLAWFIPIAVPVTISPPVWFDILVYMILALTILLSIRPSLNLFSRNQLMNFNYNPFHLVGTYGAFGAITKERYEIIIEGTTDEVIASETEWIEYEFKAKPGKLARIPPQIAPYHLRIDWLVWFLPFRVRVIDHKIYFHGYERWFINFIKKLLEGDRATLKLLKNDPFPQTKPQYIRAKFYLYKFSTKEEKRKTGNIWKRSLIDIYLPEICLKDLS